MSLSDPEDEEEGLDLIFKFWIFIDDLIMNGCSTRLTYATKRQLTKL